MTAASTASVATLRARRRAAGRCRDCNARSATPQCAACREHQTRKQRELRQRRAALRLGLAHPTPATQPTAVPLTAWACVRCAAPTHTEWRDAEHGGRLCFPCSAADGSGDDRVVCL